MKDNLIIIRTDGGICSQLLFSALGMYFEDKGYHVKYDLTWFEEDGHDIEGNKVRNYDIEKAFPGFKFEYATKDEIAKYKKIYTKNFNNVKYCQLDSFKPPMYIEQYPEVLSDLLIKLREKYIKEFRFNDDDINQKNLLSEIENSNSCGIHIRRGDYLQTSFYISTVNENYYMKAINIIRNNNPDVHFYFFSDDMNWVKETLVPKLSGYNYTLCDKNSDDKGYLDLYLLSKCKHIVASNGSLGVTAFILSDINKTELWDCKYRKYMCDVLDNIYIINCPSHKEFENELLYSFLNNLITVTKNKITKHIVVNIMGLKFKFKNKEK